MSASRDSWCWRRSPSFLGCWLIITKLSDQILSSTTPAPRSCQLVETGGKCGKWKVASEVKWWFRLQLRGATLRPSSDEITRKYVEGTFNIFRSQLFLSCVCCLNIKVPLCVNETSRVPSCPPASLHAIRISRTKWWPIHLAYVCCENASVADITTLTFSSAWREFIYSRNLSLLLPLYLETRYRSHALN